MYFKLIRKHIPRSHRFSKIFNTNNIKLRYSATANMKNFIKQHNTNVLHKIESSNTRLCNCRKKESCPLNGKCLEACIVYRAEVSTDSKYVTYYRTADSDCKSRYNNYTMSFRHKVTRTTLNCWSTFSCVMEIVDLIWIGALQHILHRTNAISYRCDLCLAE